MTDLERRWAWSQTEAMADQSLSPDDVQRMRAEMARDPALRAAVERAVRLRAALRRLPRSAVPASLALRLLRIPGAARPIRGRALSAVAAAASLAIVAALALLPRTGPPPSELHAAVAEFEVAMAYLQRSAVLARIEATNAVGGGLQDALAASREALRNEQTNSQNGDDDDAY